MAAGKQRTTSARYVLTVNVVNTSPALMEWLVSNFGGRYKCRRKANERHKATYDWWFNNGKALGLLRLIEPYLIVKRDQALLGISLMEGWVSVPFGRGAKTPPEETERREWHYKRMKALNQTGCAAATTESLGSCTVSRMMRQSELTGNCERDGRRAVPAV
jgi:hypothetical protein